MGQARRRGTYEERRSQAVRKAKRVLVRAMGGNEDKKDQALQRALETFVGRLGAEEWSRRRQGVIDLLAGSLEKLGEGPYVPIRVQRDEIGWYLLLAELALEDPLSLEVSQASRALPFLAAIGLRLDYAHSVTGLFDRFDDALGAYRSDPDGTIFEILVALSYAAAGWNVDFLPSSPLRKQPDMRATKSGLTLYIECKKLSRTSEYGEKERVRFLQMWDATSTVLIENKQWLWLKAHFKVEVSSLPVSFLADVLAESLPAGEGETIIYDGDEAKVEVRQIDRNAVAEHMSEFKVKMNSPALTTLLGGNWAPLDSAVSVATLAKIDQVVDSPLEILGAYADKISWASGITRYFTSARSIAGKARDVRKRLSDAVSQLPNNELSIVHIAYETLDGPDVEDLRFERIGKTLSKFTTDKPLVGVRVHMLQSHQTVDQLWDMEESVSYWDRYPSLLHEVPMQVVIDPNVEMRVGRHWDAVR
ncbi:hypothetical protein [Xanthomonas arboricola]|uniref:hypothetical protein n=1 Tax=Xanthomonas arboricola TaxID=56448 RepID=UPI000CC8C8C1|nr:hypothetical protein [Xanthomonas arboricola]SOU05860.1 hypothetical protein LMG19144_00900 [Xanthomonas arboricola pv. fragariae]